jgi:ankyrin repeat protein
MVASRNGFKQTVELLISYGADLCARDNAGRDALKHAAERGHSEIVDILQDRVATDESLKKEL